jgi:hypothetical protein
LPDYAHPFYSYVVYGRKPVASGGSKWSRKAIVEVIPSVVIDSPQRLGAVKATSFTFAKFVDCSPRSLKCPSNIVAKFWLQKMAFGSFCSRLLSNTNHELRNRVLDSPRLVVNVSESNSVSFSILWTSIQMLMKGR